MTHRIRILRRYVNVTVPVTGLGGEPVFGAGTREVIRSYEVIQTREVLRYEEGVPVFSEWEDVPVEEDKSALQ